MSNKSADTMQDKFVNFGKWISSLFEKYGQHTEDTAEVQNLIANYFNTEENYLSVYFSMIPGLMSQERSRNAISNIRKLKEPEPRKEALAEARKKAIFAKAVIDTFLSIPEDELDLITKRFSLYVNLFTDMYTK